MGDEDDLDKDNRKDADEKMVEQGDAVVLEGMITQEEGMIAKENVRQETLEMVQDVREEFVKHGTSRSDPSTEVPGVPDPTIDAPPS